jgi:hypothetical protein
MSRGLVLAQSDELRMSLPFSHSSMNAASRLGRELSLLPSARINASTWPVCRRAKGRGSGRIRARSKAKLDSLGIAGTNGAAASAYRRCTARPSSWRPPEHPRLPPPNRLSRTHYALTSWCLPAPWISWRWALYALLTAIFLPGWDHMPERCANCQASIHFSS